jgi:histidyl-tRNA synthetase
MIRRPRGTRDFDPEEMRKRRHVESIMRDIVERWGYEEVLTPTFEHIELFTIKSGEEIRNEMYGFIDKGGRELALRPELTAPVIRMYVESMEKKPKPLRLYYFGNCFRYERPQKGRFREFWQFGVELIGGSEVYANAEAIALAHTILSTVGLECPVRLSHLDVMNKLLSQLSEEQQRKVLRQIDKKETNIDVEEPLLSSIRSLLSPMEPHEAIEVASDIAPCEGLKTLSELVELLECYGVPYQIDFSIVRGLEYYTGIVFEMYAEGLGAENQVCGGGSYSLSELFGGESIESCGFGIGFDRVMEICKLEPPTRTKLVVVNAGAYDYAVMVSKLLREQGGNFSVELDVMERKLREQLERANTIGAKYAIVVGERERKEKLVSLRDMETGEQTKLSIDELVKFVRNL